MNSEDKLSIALSASKPLPASNTEECRELLLTADQRRPRRVTVADHARWHATGRPPHEADDIDSLLEEIRDPLPPSIKPSRIHPRHP